jgi:hypothetical protein
MHGCLSIDFVTKWWHYLVKSDVMPLLWLIFQGQRMRHLIDKRSWSNSRGRTFQSTSKTWYGGPPVPVIGIEPNL